MGLTACPGSAIYWPAGSLGLMNGLGGLRGLKFLGIYIMQISGEKRSVKNICIKLGSFCPARPGREVARLVCSIWKTSSMGIICR